MSIQKESIKNNNVELTQFKPIVIKAILVYFQSQHALDELSLAFSHYGPIFQYEACWIFPAHLLRRLNTKTIGTLDPVSPMKTWLGQSPRKP
jgi:hypothetical protein